MVSKISITEQSASKILDQLKEIQSQSTKTNASPIKTDESQGSKSFFDHLSEGVTSINEKQLTADKMAANLSSGKAENIHETMLAATQAELSFNLMVQLRNKALEAYTEIMRMPV